LGFSARARKLLELARPFFLQSYGQRFKGMFLPECPVKALQAHKKKNNSHTHNHTGNSVGRHGSSTSQGIVCSSGPLLISQCLA
jgi:hypothetical protein